MVHYRINYTTPRRPCSSESLAINRQLFGEPHPEVAANLSNLGQLARDRGDYPQAYALFAQVVAADRKILGPGHCRWPRTELLGRVRATKW